MHPYLTKLGVRPEVQEFFGNYYKPDSFGDLVFPYGTDMEHFGLAFHKVPDTNELWVAGNPNICQVRQVIIGSSAMEAVAFLHFNYMAFRQTDNLLFLSTGTKPRPGHLQWIRDNLQGKIISFVFSNDLLGRVCDLKIAAAIRALPLSVAYQNDGISVRFKLKTYHFTEEEISLNAFEKKCGYRFLIKTYKAKKHNSYLTWLKEKFNH